MHTIRVDFHCHSVYSDGALSPRELVDVLAGDGVVVAALADHNSVEGLEEFRQALARREIGFIPAVEITTQCNEREAHLLAYGIDATHSELLLSLASLRRAYPVNVHSVAETLRIKGTASSETATQVPDGRIDIVDAISLVHRAGGRAFLAHPLLLEPSPDALENILTKLKSEGLDGIEAHYLPYQVSERELLCGMAKRVGLLVSAGTDFHDRKLTPSVGIEIPDEDWKNFRDSIGAWTEQNLRSEPTSHSRNVALFKWRNILFHFIFPTLLAIGLFITAIYAVFLPAFEQTLIDRKREMIRELTNSAWSILAGFENDERSGRLSRAEAQSLAISRISTLRYGKEGKDYFWLQDMHPRILMHPYRADLNGEDVSSFRDPRGVAIFVAFADLVRRQQEGYAVYVWQWNDDPSRLVPKESYVKGFVPWGWIIGTGIYSEDVTEEIIRIERSLVNTSLVISIIVVLLLLYVILESLKLERKRAEAEEDLLESTERYRSLAEATTEGTLLLIGSRCRYANHIFLDMLKCSTGELELLDLSDLFSDVPENTLAWQQLHALQRGEELSQGFDAALKRRDGEVVDCVITVSRISLAGRDGFILHARRVAPIPSTSGSHDSIKRDQARLQLIEDSPVGMFRARATSRGTLLDYNRTAAYLFSTTETIDQQSLTLADLFADSAAYDEFLETLNREGAATHQLHHVQRDMQSRTLAIIAKLMRDDQGNPRTINGIVEDVTNQRRHEAELEATIERLQTPLLFLHEPISHMTRGAVYCTLDAPVGTVAAMITEQNASAALVQSERGNVVGIITDSDIRRRIVANGLDKSTPAHVVMSAPIETITEHAVIYEALLQMEQGQINHLAVKDEAGRFIGVVSHQELLQFQQYGPIVLTREIELASSPGDVVQSCQRVPGLVKVLIDCGAHTHVMNRLVSTVCDAATIQFIKSAEAKLGPTPVPYLFMSLGSHGRHEMTLASDQDNAIIYEPPAKEEQIPEVELYLHELGRYACEWLNRAGYPLCRGEIMAYNPRWCQPLSVWEKYFRGWIESAEPQQLLEFTVFFDFHPLFGATNLADKLRKHVFELLKESPAFYPHFAQNSLQFKPPKRLFGRIIGGSVGKEHSGVLDVKEAIIPIISFARLYSLREGIDATNTLERLQRLAETEVLNEASYLAIIEAYEFLMRLNLKHQTEAHASAQPVNNLIHLRRLGSTEQTLLYQAFDQIEAIQKRISYDFLSGMG